MATSSFLASNFKFTLPSKNPRYLSVFHGFRHQHPNSFSFNKCSKFQSMSTRIVSATTRTTASDMYVGRDNNSKIYNTNNLDSCLVFPPPTSTKPRAIIKFIGGAFIGAIPQLTYGYYYYYSLLPF
jgi:hypothetical protein